MMYYYTLKEEYQMVMNMQNILVTLQKFKDAADESVNNRPGYIVVKVETIPHSTFERDKNNLKTRV